MKLFQQILPVFILGLCAGAAMAEPLTVTPAGDKLGAVETQTEPTVTLRGFGKLDANCWRFPAHDASILLIRCQDEQKARLTLAKYDSDLQVLPGVKPARIGAQPGYQVAGQGDIVTFRSGDEVCILAADNGATIKALSRDCLSGDRSSFSYQAGVDVPMWLDRWDRFGFRFYYSYPGSVPPGQTTKTYDFTKEFDYAEKMNRAGLLFWVNESQADLAEDQLHSYTFDWALGEANRRHLPVGMQLGMPTNMPWLSNRMREETAQKMPDFVGDRYSPASDFDGGQGTISWSSVPGNAVMNALMVDLVKQFNWADCITSWLEPHSELKHGSHDILMEYGPVADKTFREFLQLKYGQDAAAVSRRWADDSVKSWDDVHVPEVASFLGWGGDAISLRGDWKVKFYDAPDPAAAPVIPPPETWALPTTADADWPTVVAPGHDQMMFLPKKPATYRRTFNIPAGWIHPGEKAWIYVWDLSTTADQKTEAWLNGTDLGQSTVLHATPHWAAYEASAALKQGDNQFSIFVPMGFIAYRAYLSRHAPVQYPNLDPGQNARWADFADWTLWSRSRAVRTTAFAVRSVDPDRGMSFASPDGYADEMRVICQQAGGEFHNTGYMGAFWAELLPMLMHSVHLPISVEPGGPAKDVDEFKNQLGLWETEGIQGIDYFIHIGSILWNPGIKQHFEEHQNEIRLTGKYHVPSAELGVLFTNRIASLVGWPWGQDLNTCLEAGYWRFDPAWYLREDFERDGVIPEDFASGHANRYKVIIDTNTSVMDDAMVRGIEDYVRQGGVFVTYCQTGRHTPEQKDAWPIERLTGYHVTSIDQLDSQGMAKMHDLKPEPGQQFFTGDAWKTFPRGNGLRMEKKADDCVDILRWADDNSVAMGMRPLGKGWIIEVGVKFAHDRIWSGDTTATRNFFCAILDHFGLPRVPATLSGPTNDFYSSTKPNAIPPMTAHALPLTLRHYQSNNGLYDIWVMWNSKKEPAVATLTFAKGFVPPSCQEVRNWTPIALQTIDGNAALPNLHFDSLETRVFITPRAMLAQAPLDWLHVQQGYWQGGPDPSVKIAPLPAPKFSLPLDEGWSFKTLADNEDATPLLAADVSTEGWQQRRLAIVNFSPTGPHHCVFRRTFTVPENWTNGRREFWLINWHPGGEFHDQGHVYLDGQPLAAWDVTDALNAQLAPGSKHTVAIEVVSKSNLTGIDANCWLQWLPAPASSQDLGGDWSGSKDFLTYNLPVKLPGDWRVSSARRNVDIDAALKGKTVMVRVDGIRAAPLGVIINGRWLRRHHHFIGNRLELNITPWVHFGQSNEIELVGGNTGTFTQATLDYYEPGTYP